jgi:hypothetical protein
MYVNQIVKMLQCFGDVQCEQWQYSAWLRLVTLVLLCYFINPNYVVVIIPTLYISVFHCNQFYFLESSMCWHWEGNDFLNLLTYRSKGKAVPLQAWSVPDGSTKLRFPDFMTRAQDGGKVVSLTHRPPLPQEIHLVLISVRGSIDLRAIVRPEGLCHWKIPMTSSEIEPATCRFVA